MESAININEEPIEEPVIKEEMIDEVFIKEEPLANHNTNSEMLVDCPKKTTITETKAAPQIVLYLCDICWKEFTDITVLKIHLQKHLKNVCEVCEKQFETKAGLSTHMNVHSKNCVFSCIMCDEKFSLLWQLNEHLTVHTEKLCGCKICGERFPHPRDLHKHIMFTHNDSRKCNLCSKSFKKAASLNLHIRKTHTGGSHTCKICDAVFSSVLALRNHAKNHTCDIVKSAKESMSSSSLK